MSNVIQIHFIYVMTFIATPDSFLFLSSSQILICEPTLYFPEKNEAIKFDLTFLIPFDY